MTRSTSPLPGTQSESSKNKSELSGEGIVLSYGKNTVVHGVGLRIKPGEVVALIGPNGSGKSTVLRSLARLHQVDAGNILLQNENQGQPIPISSFSATQFAREVTLFTQSRPAPQGLSVAEVISFGRHPYRKGWGRLSDEDNRAIQQAMAVTGVTDMAPRPVAELSGGEMQRVWLAACLAQETGIVLLDEPTNHLDLRYQIETLDLVRELADQQQVGVGIVLHDLDQAADVADFLLLMSEGLVYAAGTPSEVLTSENITDVYGIQVEVEMDPHNGRLRIDPIGRYRAHNRKGKPVGVIQ